MDSICQRNVNVTVDRVGRVNILVSLKEKFNIVEKEKFEIYIENGNIVLKVIDNDEINNIVEEKVCYNGNCILNVKKLNGHYVRSVDELLRIVLPVELRDELGIKENDKVLEYGEDKNKIILQPIQ